VSERYELIDAEKDTMTDIGERKYTITQMCRWSEVSTSGFYEWRGRPASATTERRERLAAAVSRIFDDSDETYGHRRIHAQLVREGALATPELVRAVMRDLGLVACQPRPWRHCLTDADPTAAPLPDLVCRDFTASVPGEKLVGDFTYIPTWVGWVYLATVIDCCTSEVVGWAIDDNYKTPLIETAIRMAACNHDLVPGAIFHSDRGSNYTSQRFAETLESLDIRQSVGRTGICYDNAMAESFFGVLKTERVNRTVYPTRKHAERDIASYIELRYNIKRLHSGLGYRTPREVRDEYYNGQQAA
jgi:transposase InsO family protein